MSMNSPSSRSWMSWNTGRWSKIAIAVAIASANVLYLREFTVSTKGNHRWGNRFPGLAHQRYPLEETRTTSTHDYKHHSNYKHDFAYNSERFDKSPPRIVILAGPHKAASSTIQEAISTLTAWTVRLEETPERKERIEPSKPPPKLNKEYRPHPAIRRTNWVWPLGIPAEYFGLPYLGNNKFYAKLGGVLYKDRSPERESKLQDFRYLFSQAWQEGKKIVVGSERFDFLVSELSRNQSTSMAASTKGEATHVAPSSSWMIDELLSVFPWDNATQTATATPTATVPTAGDSRRTQPRLRLDDIEVQINYRTPRSDHIRSMWHTLSKDTDESLQQVLTSPDRIEYLFWTNSLAMALQLVRKNVKTTIIDMGGVKEKEFKEENLTMSTNEDTESESVLLGVPGIVACDILRMGTHRAGRGLSSPSSSPAWCDDQSRLHVPNRNSRKKPLFADVNSKKDARPTNLTQKQMEEIEDAYTRYDCGVWQHLQKYQAKGSLRILYPAEHLFETCNPRGGSNRDISFVELLETIRAIASGENG